MFGYSLPYNCGKKETFLRESGAIITGRKMADKLENLAEIINDNFAIRSSIAQATASAELLKAVHEVLSLLNSGEARVAEPQNGGWVVNEWLKKAVLLSFRTSADKVIEGNAIRWYDRVPNKFAEFGKGEFSSAGVRAVPPATVRHGAHIAHGVVLMPSFVNIGAYVGERTMVDTWATVGSCAQIGADVHLSGGCGIGGVLEPLQACPTIIEDGCFIGARSEIVEGVIVGAGSVISMGVFIGQSTKIYDRTTGAITRGNVPPGSVVVPGSLPSENGQYSLACAIIVKRVDEKTRAKTSVNDLLRMD